MLEPYLSKYGEALATKLGQSSVDNIGKIFGRIQSKFKGKPDAEKALAEFSKAPNDGKIQETFTEQLQSLFNSEPSFAREIAPYIAAQSIFINTQNNYFQPLSSIDARGLDHQDVGNKRRKSQRGGKQVKFQQDKFANSFLETGKTWNFWSTKTDNSSVFWIKDGAVGVGDSDNGKLVVATAQTPCPALTNLLVDFELRILEDYGVSENWAGIRLRGLTPYQEIGYLVYLRSTGNLELYRAHSPSWDGGRLAVPSPLNKWVQIKIECKKSTIKVWVGKRTKPHIEVVDHYFGGEGYIFFHAYGTKAQFRNLKVYSLG